MRNTHCECITKMHVPPSTSKSQWGRHDQLHEEQKTTSNSITNLPWELNLRSIATCPWRPQWGTAHGAMLFHRRQGAFAASSIFRNNLHVEIRLDTQLNPTVFLETTSARPWRKNVCPRQHVYEFFCAQNILRLSRGIRSSCEARPGACTLSVRLKALTSPR